MSLHLLFLVSLLSLAQAANLIRLADAPIEVIGFWRLAGASLLMFLWAHLQKNPGRPPLVSWASLSGVFFFLHLWTYFYAAQNTSIANCMILFATNPIYTALITRWIQKQKLPKNIQWAYPLAFIGIFLSFYSGSQLSPLHMMGDLAGFASAIFYSLYLVTGQKSRQTVPNSTMTSWIYLITAFLFFATGTVKDVDWWNHPPVTWWSILGLIIFPTVLGHALFTYLVKFLNINWMSCGKLMEPVVASAMAYLIFSEPIGLTTIVAFVFTSISVLVLYYPILISAFKKLRISS